MDEPLIALEGITKAYGTGEARVLALDGLDLSVGHGEFVAVMGPSGSGKSTAMNIVGYLDSPSSGRYLFDGVAVETATREQRTLLHAPARPVHRPADRVADRVVAAVPAVAGVEEVEPAAVPDHRRVLDQRPLPAGGRRQQPVGV